MSEGSGIKQGEIGFSYALIGYSKSELISFTDLFCRLTTQHMKLFVHTLMGAVWLGALLSAGNIPNPLAVLDGEHSVSNWEERGRSQTLKVFSEQVFGITPSGQILSEWKLDRESEALGGKAIRREYSLTFKKSVSARVLVYLPKSSEPVPVFMGLNANGNHTIEKDAWITSGGVAKRGKSSQRWPLEMIIKSGRGLVTVHCADFDPDENDGFKNGVHGLFPAARDDKSWGTLGAWAWGMSRILDQLATVPEIDEKSVAVIGFSRLGKAALWAGAQDERFAMVVSSSSGCGGAALSKRRKGETVGKITRSFPHWFCGHFAKYSNKESEMAFDQHQLLACIAPRPIYVSSASEDSWADPEGEFLALMHAAPVYALYHQMPFEGRGLPEPGVKVGGHLMRYHLSEGRHNITSWDWERYLTASEDWLKK